MQGRGFKEVFGATTGCSPTNLPCLAGKALGITKSINSNKLTKVNKILEAIRDSPGLNTGVEELTQNLSKMGSGMKRQMRSDSITGRGQSGGCGGCGGKCGGELFLPGRSVMDQMPKSKSKTGGELFVKGRGMKISSKDGFKMMKGKGMMAL